VIFPVIQRKYNNRRLYILFTAAWAVAFFFLPLGNIVAKLMDAEGVTERMQNRVMWGVIGVLLLPNRVAVNVYPLNMIIVKTSIDNPAYLGSMFGLQQTFSSSARAIAPTFVSVLFAFNVERQILGGYFVWVVLVLIGLFSIYLSWTVKNAPSTPSIRSRAGSPSYSRSTSSFGTIKGKSRSPMAVGEPRRSRAMSSVSPSRS